MKSPSLFFNPSLGDNCLTQPEVNKASMDMGAGEFTQKMIDKNCWDFTLPSACVPPGEGLPHHSLCTYGWQCESLFCCPYLRLCLANGTHGTSVAQVKAAVKSEVAEKVTNIIFGEGFGVCSDTKSGGICLQNSMGRVMDEWNQSDCGCKKDYLEMYESDAWVGSNKGMTAYREGPVCSLVSSEMGFAEGEMAEAEGEIGEGDLDMMRCMRACSMAEKVLESVGAQMEKGSLLKEMCAPLEEALTCMMEEPTCGAMLASMMQNEEDAKKVEEVCGDTGMSKITATTVTATTTQTFVESSFKIEGIDLADLSADDQAAMVSGQQESIAKAAGVTKDEVTVTLEAGSINVKALIKVLKDMVAALEKKMKSPDAKLAIYQGVKKSPVLKKAVEAKGKTMDDLKVSEPVVTTKTVAPKPKAKAAEKKEEAPKGTPQPKAAPAPAKAPAAVADLAAGLSGKMQVLLALLSVLISTRNLW